MRKLLKYYKNEIFSYWLGSLLPFIFVAEIMIYRRETYGINPDVELILQTITGMCIVAGMFLSLSQIVYTFRFVKDYRSLQLAVTESRFPSRKVIKVMNEISYIQIKADEYPLPDGKKHILLDYES